MYLAVIALSAADFGLVADSQRIWQLQNAALSADGGSTMLLVAVQEPVEGVEFGGGAGVGAGAVDIAL